MELKESYLEYKFDPEEDFMTKEIKCACKCGTVVFVNEESRKMLIEKKEDFGVFAVGHKPKPRYL